VQPLGTMAASKDCCSHCKKAIYSKQKVIRCSGPCASRYHLSCLKMSDTEFSFFMVDGVSTYKCVSCVLSSRRSGDDSTPIRNLRSASTSELSLKVVSPDREIVLPKLKDTESLIVQFETVRLNGASTHSLVENLVQVVLKLSENLHQLRKVNEYLKFHLNRFIINVPGPSVHAIRPSPSAQGSCTSD
jgi:hypothetical protein